MPWRPTTAGFAPGRPISRVLSWAVISLGRRLPAASSGPPGARTGRAAPCGGRAGPCPRVAPAWPCSRWGLPGRPGHPGRRWSLTPPFHPCPPHRWLASGTRWRSVSVALSVGLPRLGVTQHRALWSPDFPHPAHGAKRDRLADLEQLHLNMLPPPCQAMVSPRSRADHPSPGTPRGTRARGLPPKTHTISPLSLRIDAIAGR